ncbi:MAG: hypothetical protein EZS28_016847 [Streblomastix strix]|uniref:Uncharacterized protein n=1 Tax=Streblomastix strix TaxID=222440 RepID=A0A5J4VZF5_9EUKA|nr:MAG: hypothetical protein EZS28_016847 [Streblomastix strix]
MSRKRLHKLDVDSFDEEEPQREIQTERPRNHSYNIIKYKDVPRETAQVEPEQVEKDPYLSHPNLEKEIIRIDVVLIKNVSISNIDNVIWNSIEKLYCVNKVFVRLSDNLESNIGPDDF